MDVARLLPPELVARARALAAGDITPVEPRAAATVILLRASGAGPEVYLLRRHGQMAFAGGMYVFPGGVVDERDRSTSTRWAGPAPAAWAETLRCDEATARALVCAAVRETFEESGVLLAGRTPGSVVADTTGDHLAEDRRALVEKLVSFAQLLDRRGLVLRSDLLTAWAHWITPAFEPRRYDTRFFVATMPVGQRARDVSGEADKVVWLAPGEACAAVDTGRMRMLPPTYAVCRELSRLRDPEDAATVDHSFSTIVPFVEFDGDEAVFRTGLEDSR